MINTTLLQSWIERCGIQHTQKQFSSETYDCIWDNDHGPKWWNFDNVPVGHLPLFQDAYIWFDQDLHPLVLDLTSTLDSTKRKRNEKEVPFLLYPIVLSEFEPLLFSSSNYELHAAESQFHSFDESKNQICKEQMQIPSMFYFHYFVAALYCFIEEKKKQN
jgi:hypothetical protein